MVKKKHKITHTVLIVMSSFFLTLLLVTTIAAQVYKSIGPTQEVAGAASSSAERKNSPSVTPTQSSCTIMVSVVGQAPCGKDTYRGVAVTCGDGSQPKISSNQECKSLTAWFTQLVKACIGHSSCKPSGTPTPKVSPSVKPTHPSVSPHPTESNHK